MKIQGDITIVRVLGYRFDYHHSNLFFILCGYAEDSNLVARVSVAALM